jgi:hypothetical protein
LVFPQDAVCCAPRRDLAALYNLVAIYPEYARDGHISGDALRDGPVAAGSKRRLADDQVVIDAIVTTNTVPIPTEKRLPNMTVLSIGPLMAETIHRIHCGESVSSLFFNAF